MNLFKIITCAGLVAIFIQLRHIQNLLTTMATDQQTLDNDVQAIADSFATVVYELKLQAANAGASLNFSKLDALVASIKAEADSDAPPTPGVAVPAPVSDPTTVAVNQPNTAPVNVPVDAQPKPPVVPGDPSVPAPVSGDVDAQAQFDSGVAAAKSGQPIPDGADGHFVAGYNSVAPASASDPAPASV